jgi:hypothetical protein
VPAGVSYRQSTPVGRPAALSRLCHRACRDATSLQQAASSRLNVTSRPPIGHRKHPAIHLQRAGDDC